MKLLFRFVFIAFSVFILPSPPTSAEETRIRAVYDIYFGGFYVLRTESHITMSPLKYKITSHSQTKGALSFFFDWMGEASSEGIFDKRQAVPKFHKNIGRRANIIRTTELTYDNKGALVSSKVTPAADLLEVTELPPKPGLGTIDPLSIIAHLSYAIKNDGSCNGTFAVFDGRRRYNLKISDKGTTTLSKTPYSSFHGTALACKVEYQMLGGHRRKRLKYTKNARERFIYAAQPFPIGPILPVGLSIETELGSLVAHLSSVSLEILEK